MGVRIISTVDKPYSASTSQSISRPNYGYAPIDFNLLTPTGWTRNFKSGSITSTSSPGFYVKKPFYVRWKPKKFPLSPPRRPRFNPPKIPKEPRYSVKKSRRARANNTRLARTYREVYKHALERRVAYLKKYNARLTKYESRLAHYNRLVALQKGGMLRYKRVAGKSFHRPNNPYSYSLVEDFGFNGVRVRRAWCYHNIDTRTIPARHYYALGRQYKDIYIFEKLIGYMGTQFTTHGTLNSAPLLAATESKAISTLYERLSDQSVHIAMLVAERAQTFSLIADIAKTLASIVKMKKKIFSIGAKTIANDVLAFNFGVKPLLADAYGAGLALARLATSDQSDKVVVKSSSQLSDSTRTVSIDTLNTCRVVREVTCTIKVSYVLEYRVKNGALGELQKLGLVNPAEVAWEALPWSFVVDWFLPLGNYITSLSADAGLEFVTGTKVITTTYDYITTIDYLGADKNNTYDTWEGSVFGRKKTKTKVRTVLSTAPSPRLPSFKSPISPTHLIDSLALLIQLKK